MKHLKTLTAGFLLALLSLVAIVPQADAAFSASKLVLVSPVGVDAVKSSRIFTYTTSDTQATVETANYFQSSKLAAGDFIQSKTGSGNLVHKVIAASATTSTLAQVGATVICAPGTGYGTAGAVARLVSPIAGTVTKYNHLLTIVVDADVILNLDIAGTNATGSATIAVASVAVGDIDTATVTAGGAVTANQLITVESDGGGTVGAGTTCVTIVP